MLRTVLATTGLLFTCPSSSGSCALMPPLPGQYDGCMNLGFSEMGLYSSWPLLFWAKEACPRLAVRSEKCSTSSSGRPTNFARRSRPKSPPLNGKAIQPLQILPPSRPPEGAIASGTLVDLPDGWSTSPLSSGIPDLIPWQGSQCLKWRPSCLRRMIRKDSMPAMGFLDHLEELRRRIIYSLIAVVVGFFACWGYAEKIYEIMQRPIMEALHRNGLSEKLVYLNPTEPFNLYLKVGFMAGLFVASPFVLYQVWLFISPGLYRNEKRYVMPFMVSTVGLFLAGGYFGYKLVYPQALEFLIGYGKQFQPMITIGEYTDLFLTIIIGMGAIFELPILVFFLSLMGIITAGWMWRNLRYSILVIFIIAAILTPTTDIMNMCIFAAPMVALYVLSIGIAWAVHPKQRRARSNKKDS